MLTIRQAQVEVFSQLEVEKFEKWVLTHLEKFFPAQCSTAGHAQLTDLIRTAMTRAESYQIVSKREVCKYIDLTIAFGRDFDRDRRYPWAGEILAMDLPAAQKLEQLLSAAQNHLSRALSL